MNKLIYFAGIAVILAVLAWMASREAGQPSHGERLLKGFQPENVTKVEILQGNQKVSLALQPEGWKVLERENYPADSARVLRLIRTIWELRPTQTLPASPEDWPRLGLAVPQAQPAGSESTDAADNESPGSDTAPIIIRFLADSDKPLSGIVLGKLHTATSPQGPFSGPPTGRYVRAETADRGAALVNNPFFEVSASPESWLNREFPRLGDLESLAWTPTGSEKPSWLIKKVEGQWQLEDSTPQQTNQDSARSAESSLQTWHFEDVSKQDFNPRGLLTARSGEVTWEITVGEETAGKVPIRLAAKSLGVDSKSHASQSEATASTEQAAEQATDAAAHLTPSPEQPNPAPDDEGTLETTNPTTENLKAAAQYEGWTFLIPSYVFQSVLVERDKFIAPEPAQQAEAESSPEGVDNQQKSGSGAHTDPVTAP